MLIREIDPEILLTIGRTVFHSLFAAHERLTSSFSELLAL